MTGQGAVRPDGSRVELIHLSITLGRQERVACVPDYEALSAQSDRTYPWRRSDDPRAVTCERCRQTDIFQAVEVELKRGLAARRYVS